jgi:hypothetical protein
LNDKVIWQKRYFGITDFNSNCKKSLDIKELISEVITIRTNAKGKHRSYPMAILSINFDKKSNPYGQRTEDMFKINKSGLNYR